MFCFFSSRCADLSALDLLSNAMVFLSFYCGQSFKTFFTSVNTDGSDSDVSAYLFYKKRPHSVFNNHCCNILYTDYWIPTPNLLRASVRYLNFISQLLFQMSLNHQTSIWVYKNPFKTILNTPISFIRWSCTYFIVAVMIIHKAHRFCLF